MDNSSNTASLAARSHYLWQRAEYESLKNIWKALSRQNIKLSAFEYDSFQWFLKLDVFVQAVVKQYKFRL